VETGVLLSTAGTVVEEVKEWKVKTFLIWNGYEPGRGGGSGKNISMIPQACGS
jgi:hypothetical protein